MVAFLAFIAYLAGMTSTLGVLIAAVNSQCRLIFNAGREGLLPRWIGRVDPVRRTPRKKSAAATRRCATRAGR